MSKLSGTEVCATVDELAADDMQAATIDMDRRTSEETCKYKAACDALSKKYLQRMEAIRRDYNAAYLLARRNAEQHIASLAATQRKESLADQHAKEVAYFGCNVLDGTTHGSYAEARQATKQFNSTLDCRVRPSHAALHDGKEFVEARQVTIFNSNSTDSKNYLLPVTTANKIQRLLDSLTSDKPVAVKLATKALEVVDTLLRKNSDYGGKITEQSPSLAPDVSPSTAILVRLSDKYERMINLLTNGNQQVEESFNETMLDEIGYSILYLVSQE